MPYYTTIHEPPDHFCFIRLEEGHINKDIGTKMSLEAIKIAQKHDCNGFVVNWKQDYICPASLPCVTLSLAIKLSTFCAWLMEQFQNYRL